MRKKVIVIFFAGLCLSGCAARVRPAGAWRLQPLDRGHVLVPPQPPRTAQGEMQELTLAKARRPARPSKGCGVAGSQIQLEWRGRTAVVRVQAKLLQPPAEVVLTGPQSPKGVVFPDFSWFTGFQQKLSALEGDGRCLASGDAGALAGRIIEHLTLPPDYAYQLRYGEHIRAGYFDLDPQFQVKTIARANNGWETAWFDLERKGGGALHVRPRNAEVSVAGKVVSYGKPSTAADLTLPANARYLRMFFRSWNIGVHRKLALLAAPQASALDAAVKRFETDPEKFCQAPEPAGAYCITIPFDTALYAELKIRANGRQVGVPIKGTLSDLLRSAGVKDPRQFSPP